MLGRFNLFMSDHRFCLYQTIYGPSEQTMFAVGTCPSRIVLSLYCVVQGERTTAHASCYVDT